MLRALVVLIAFLFSTPALAEDVTLKAEDGTRLHASYDDADSSQKGVILLHMLGRHAGDWRFLAEKLNQSGLATLAVDLRGHGKNVPEGSTAELTDADYMAMKQDVAAAVEFMRSKGHTEISLVGASIGANLALVHASQDPEIVTVVLLSPGMDYKGVDTSEAINLYGERPLLIAVSKEDNYSAKSSLVLDSQARGHHVLEIYQSAGHGTKMLNKAPALEPLLISWLTGAYHLSDAEGSKASVKAGDASAVETTGKRLGEE